MIVGIGDQCKDIRRGDDNRSAHEAEKRGKGKQKSSNHANPPPQQMWQRPSCQSGDDKPLQEMLKINFGQYLAIHTNYS